MSADKREDIPGDEALEDEFRAMFAERSERVRMATAPYAAVRQRIVAARRKRRVRLGSAGVAFAVAAVGIGVWAAVPGRHQAAVPPTSGPPMVSQPAKVFYDDGHSELPAGPLRDAAVNWLRANYHDDLSGLTVVTTFKQQVQDAATTAAAAKGSAAGGGIAVVDSHTGAVLALAGAWDRPLPVADLMKPLMLAAAFTDYHYTPNSKVPLDAQTHPLFWPQGATQPLTYPAGGQPRYWPPENSGTPIQNTDITLRQAAEIGANEPFAQLELAADMGPAKLRSMAENLGMPHGTKDLVPVASLVLGTPLASPLTMATVYATLADEGVRHDPQMVARVLAKNGTPVWTPTDDAVPVLPSGSALPVTDILHSTLAEGTTGTDATARKLAGPDTWAMAAASDTKGSDTKGSVPGVWFDGADRQYVVSVGLPAVASGGPAAGSRLAGPIWAGLVQTLRGVR